VIFPISLPLARLTSRGGVVASRIARPDISSRKAFRAICISSSGARWYSSLESPFQKFRWIDFPNEF
jgi:hypothetical protein